MAEFEGGLNIGNERVKEVRIQIARKVIFMGAELTKGHLRGGVEENSDRVGKSEGN